MDSILFTFFFLTTSFNASKYFKTDRMVEGLRLSVIKTCGGLYLIESKHCVISILDIDLVSKHCVISIFDIDLVSKHCVISIFDIDLVMPRVVRRLLQT